MTNSLLWVRDAHFISFYATDLQYDRILLLSFGRMCGKHSSPVVEAVSLPPPFFLKYRLEYRLLPRQVMRHFSTNTLVGSTQCKVQSLIIIYYHTKSISTTLKRAFSIQSCLDARWMISLFILKIILFYLSIFFQGTESIYTAYLCFSLDVKRFMQIEIRILFLNIKKFSGCKI